MRTKQHVRRIEKKEKENKLLVQSQREVTTFDISREGIQIIFKKQDEITNSISFQIPVVIKPPTFMEDIIS